ncbi:DUF1992 domain-containing protein [Cytobacillus kochii]|uniref:DnaJ family domain-containing protein n=1 Tax=Cytobacillus kochii TaxID=859143 RepID=UPI001CD681D1|nr:DUF1992 domain-containing protein [Cytobacillus kochii]MCA1024973.1 DUF1992 domain-containing protein [Cytobacillus kochii]
MDLFSILAEEKIKQAQRQGEFAHLKGHGKPLPKDELSGVPESLRMSYKIMKNAGYTTKEIDLRKEMLTIEQLIASCENEEKEGELKKELNEKRLKFQSLLSERKVATNTQIFKNYEQKIENKLFK